jgi:hypothetical protein
MPLALGRSHETSSTAQRPRYTQYEFPMHPDPKVARHRHSQGDQGHTGTAYLYESDLHDAQKMGAMVSDRVVEFVLDKVVRDTNQQLSGHQASAQPVRILYLPQEVVGTLQNAYYSQASDAGLPPLIFKCKDQPASSAPGPQLRTYIGMPLEALPESAHATFLFGRGQLVVPVMDQWHNTSENPVWKEARELGEVVQDRQRALYSEATHIVTVVGGEQHFVSMIVANIHNLGMALGVQCEVSQEQRGNNPFVICVGDGLIPNGGSNTVFNEPRIFEFTARLVQGIIMTYNFRACTGLMRVTPGAAAYIDYRDSALVAKIVQMNCRGLHVYKQGPMMCAFQSCLHVEQILKSVVRDVIEGKSISDLSWPGQCTTNSAGAMVLSGVGFGANRKLGTKEEEGLAFRRKVVDWIKDLIRCYDT